ncbi:MAG: 3-deoxy-7-phosphoheptulonate synthase [Acidobacteria bacterium]|nr:3-deoxy-7-phosphoheptulonate synthase [Acidobacteriota bacterium]
MVIVMSPGATEAQVQKVIEALVERGFDAHRSTGTTRTVIGAVGKTGSADPRDFRLLGGVADVVRISEPYKLAGRTFQSEDTRIQVAGVEIGGPEVVVMAGPCAVESQEQVHQAAAAAAAAGARILRGGAFKPRTSPYTFQGLGAEGLGFLKVAGREHGLAVVSEILDTRDVPLFVEQVDIIQVGARNMQNFALLKELARVQKPVLLKRGMSATLNELLLSAEYLMSGGNRQVILCERGIRTFETSTRNTMDLSAIPVLKSLSHLPVIADPSHGTGLRDFVVPMARAAVAAGADGLLVEVHPHPEEALSDGAQSLPPEMFASLMAQIRIIVTAMDRTLSQPGAATAAGAGG